MLRLILLILMSASSAIAESVVIGMDKEKVAITATFDGSQILLFGAVKRDKPAPLGIFRLSLLLQGHQSQFQSIENQRFLEFG